MVLHSGVSAFNIGCNYTHIQWCPGRGGGGGGGGGVGNIAKKAGIPSLM